MADPLVSIIVRTKDRPVLLREALRSISDQTYRHIQVCLVNDGGCEVDLEEIKGILGNIGLHYIRHETCQGRGAALNKGLEESEGMYVGILDDDDIYYPHAIRTLLNVSVGNENRPVYGQVVCGKEETEDSGKEPSVDLIMGEPFCLGKMLFENFIPTNALLVPKIWIEKAGPFDNDFEIFEDWEWMIRLAQVCEPLFVETPVGEYRIFSDATITGKGGENLHRTFREKLLNRHMEKANAGDFLDHVQKMVDKVVLEKEAIINKLEERLEELTHQVEIKTEWVKKRDEHIREKDEYIRLLGDTVHSLEHTVHELEDGLRERDREILRIVSSLSWKVARPLNTLARVVRKAVGKGKNG